MAETVKIPGELESTATGNKVADVANIKDKTKGNKSQAQINAETEASLADRYTKAETYNKTELNNMITTPNQQYASVTATVQTTDVTDVLPATGEAATVYRVGNWDGTQYDETCYSEYSWNGSQYVHLSTKTQIGEVFDISAYHATGGTLATYADLSAALDSNNGGGVPLSLQKGGMSIKFVQSSDNKYVQFRLIADTFTTDVTKWEGTGDKPKQDSLLVRITKEDVVSGYYYPASGDILPSGSNASVCDPRKYSVAPGMILYLTFKTRYRVQYILWDEDGDYVSGFDWNAHIDSIVIPNGVYFISICFSKVAGGTLLPSGFDAVSISSLQTKLDSSSKEILTSGGWIQDTILASGYSFESGTYSDGLPVANNKRIRTTKIRCAEVRSIVVPEGYLCTYTVWDIFGNRLLQGDFPSSYVRVINPAPVDGMYEVGIVFCKIDDSVIDPVPQTIGEQIYIKSIVDIKDVIYHKKNLVSTDFYQGTISSGNYVYDRLDRIRTALYKISELKSIIALENNSFYVSCTLFDKDKKFVSQSLDFGKRFDNISVGDGYIAFVVKKYDGSNISPSDISDGDITILYKEQSTIQESKDIKNYLIKLYSITSMGSGQVGKPFYDSTNKVLKVLTFGSYCITIPFIDGAIYTYNNEFYVWNGTDLVKSSGGIPEGGTAGQVLTPSGWSSDFVTLTSLQTLLLGYTKNVDLATELNSYLTKAEFNGALSDYETSAHVTQLLNDYLMKTDTVSNIASSAITVPMLSQAVLDLISAGGGSTITNMPDDIDIEVDSNNRLQLKGGGVVRFRLKSTPADNYQEMLRCLAVGLPIQIENPIDLAHSDGSIRDINLNGATLTFVGNGMIKNCKLISSKPCQINADRKKVFDNVYLWSWDAGASTDNLNEIYLDSSKVSNRDVYNRLTKTLSAASVSVAVNPFYCSLTYYKIGSFVSPILNGDKYIYSEDGGITAKLTFTVVDGNIQIPVTKEYLFTDLQGNVLESTFSIKDKTANYVYVAPSGLKITRLIPIKKSTTCGISSEIYPEWFGAVTNSGSFDCKDALQSCFLVGGAISLVSNSYYYNSGNIRVYSNTEIIGHYANLIMKSNSASYCMLELETIDGIVNQLQINNLNLYGNKSNNASAIQDGIFVDLGKGIYPFSGYSMNNTYWYNLTVAEFTGSGISCAVPGTSHIYSSYLTANNYDGITWDFEHFTLTNVTCWGNGRHGAYASGNHWRIIGGAYAHNDAGDNIHCEGAFESQIIGCSCIDSGQFVPQTGGGYVASSANVYGYIWAGEGQGTHALIGGNGINLNNCRRITMLAVRVNNQNANGMLVRNSQNIVVADCQFNENNMTRGLFQDIDSDINSLYISNTFRDGRFIVSNAESNFGIPKYFGNNSVRADWNALQNYIENFGPGTFFVADFYNASNRPSDADTYLEGTIQVINGLSDSAARTFIRLSDKLGNQYYRYCTIRYSDGVYVEDSGWKKTFSA